MVTWKPWKRTPKDDWLLRYWRCEKCGEMNHHTKKECGTPMCPGKPTEYQIYLMPGGPMVKPK